MPIIIADGMRIIRHHANVGMPQAIQPDGRRGALLIHERLVAVPESVQSGGRDPEVAEQWVQFAFDHESSIPGRAVPRGEHQGRRIPALLREMRV